MKTDDYATQRGSEQIIHDRYRPPMNKIRPIDPKNPRRQDYLDAAARLAQDEIDAPTPLPRR